MSVLHSARFAAMNLLLIASTSAALQVERATAPSFRGEGGGKLVVLADRGSAFIVRAR